MYDFRPNLEPGNADGHTVLRYLVESKQMPLETAIERVYQAVAKYAQDYRSDQNKLLGGMVVTGVLSLPVFFPFGMPSLLIAGAIGASAFAWQELGVMRDRLKPEYQALKGSVLLEQFIKWLAQELRERRNQVETPGFHPDAITTANILAAYEHTIFAVTHGEHLDNNASDPILALFVVKLRQHTNHLPDWVVQAFGQLEAAETQRASDLKQAYGYMWGNLAERYPSPPAQPPQIGTTTRLRAVDVPVTPIEPVEGEQSLGKPIEPIPNNNEIIPTAPPLVPAFHQSLAQNKQTPVDIALQMAQVLKSTIIAASPRVGKGVVVSMAIAYLRQLHPDLEIWLLDPKDEPTERHYWELIDPDKRCHFDLRDFDVEIEEAVEAFSDLLTRFNRSPKHRKLLIIDEFVTLNQKCAGQFMNQLKDFVVGICSSGEVNPDMSIGRFVWAITQSPYVSDLGFKTKAALSSFQRVFLLSKASISLYQLAVSASFVPDGAEQKVSKLVEATGRIFYYSRTDSWHPVPSYTLPAPTSNNHLHAQLDGLISGVSDNAETISEMPETTPKRPETPETLKRNPETLKQPNEDRFSDSSDISFQRFTKLKLSFQDAKELVARLRNEMSQTKVIETLWDAKPGESKAYKDALAEYKMLTEEA